MKVGLVGEEVPSGNAAQGIVAFELLDQQLDPCPVVVEPPEVEGAQGEIRHEDLVVIPAELEERQLVAGLLGLESPDDDEARGMEPPNGLIAEFGNLDPMAGADIPQVRQLAFDRGSESGNDDEPSAVGFQPLDERMVVKPFVRADNRQPDPSRPLRETRREQVECPPGGVGIAGAQLSVPEVLGPPFETEQGVIRWSPAFERIVADRGLLLLAVEHQHSGVDIEDQPRWGTRVSGHACQKAIVQFAEFRERRWRDAQQEPPQRGRIRVGLQPREVLIHAILAQQVGGLDAFESEDHGVEHGQHHLADAVAVVPLHHLDVVGHRVLESDARQKSMNEVDPTVMGQRLGAKRHAEISRSSGHRTESYLLGSVQSNRPVRVFCSGLAV